MTREKAVQVEHLLYKIERYEALLSEMSSLDVLEEIKDTYGQDGVNIELELIDVVQSRLNKLLKELEDL